MKYKDTVEAKRSAMADQLLDFIENNPTAWEAGWYKVGGAPRNGKTDKAYNGLNALWLYLIAEHKGYTDPRWVTYQQAKDLKASVKAGEKSSNVFYWSWYDKKTKKPFDDATVKDMSKDERQKYLDENVRPVLKYYQVFNAAQCQNFPKLDAEQKEMPADERARQSAKIENIISNSAAPVYYDGGNRAYYSPGRDSIHLPEIHRFHTMQDYYATALHEIAHSTGRKERLNRDMSGAFGSVKYAQEELRAELASVFMQLDLDIRIEGKHFENHGAYLQSWLKRARADKKEFFAAVTDAEKISQYVGEHYLHENEVEAALAAAAEENTKEQEQAATKVIVLEPEEAAEYLRGVEINERRKAADNEIYGLIYDWKGLKEENSLYTGKQLKELDAAFVPEDRYEGALAANKTYTVIKLTGETPEETDRNVREFLTGKYNEDGDMPFVHGWYWETVDENFFTGEKNQTTIDYINRLNIPSEALRMDENVMDALRNGINAEYDEFYAAEMSKPKSELLGQEDTRKLYFYGKIRDYINTKDIDVKTELPEAHLAALYEDAPEAIEKLYEHYNADRERLSASSDNDIAYLIMDYNNARHREMVADAVPMKYDEKVAEIVAEEYRNSPEAADQNSYRGASYDMIAFDIENRNKMRDGARYDKGLLDQRYYKAMLEYHAAGNSLIEAIYAADEARIRSGLPSDTFAAVKEFCETKLGVERLDDYTVNNEKIPTKQEIRQLERQTKKAEKGGWSVSDIAKGGQNIYAEYDPALKDHAPIPTMTLLKSEAADLWRIVRTTDTNETVTGIFTTEVEAKKVFSGVKEYIKREKETLPTIFGEMSEQEQDAWYRHSGGNEYAGDSIFWPYISQIRAEREANKNWVFAFKAPVEYAELNNQLKELGYVRALDEAIKWSNKTGSSLIADKRFDEQGEPISRIEGQQLDRVEADRILQAVGLNASLVRSDNYGPNAESAREVENTKETLDAEEQILRRDNLDQSQTAEQAEQVGQAENTKGRYQLNKEFHREDGERYFRKNIWYKQGLYISGNRCFVFPLYGGVQY